jgi:predicted O-linked N-acetylglucosamine transferase (SPINDLY family)
MLTNQIKQEIDSGIQYYRSGDYPAAEACFHQVLQWQQDNADAWHLLGIIAMQQGNYATAIERINYAIKLKPTDVNFRINLGNAFQELGQLEAAISTYQQVIQLDSSALDAHYNLGLALQKQGNLEGAIASYQHVIELNPNYDSAYINLGIAFKAQGNLEQAIEAYQCALLLKPDNYFAYNNLGIAFKEQGKLEEAISSFEHVLKLKPDYYPALANLGNSLKLKGELDKAVSCYQHALQVNPDDPMVCYNLGDILRAQGKLDEAISAYLSATYLKPDHYLAQYYLGLSLQEQGQFEAAVDCYLTALRLKPDNYLAHYNLGIALQAQGNLEEAAVAYHQALQHNPNHMASLRQYVWAKRLICDWEGLHPFEQSLISMTQSEQWTEPPFPLIAISDDPVAQLAEAQNFCAHYFGKPSSVLWQGQRAPHDRIRLAYLSADYHEHATAYLMAELFERHDRTQFELFAISFGPESNSPMRQRLVQAFDHFIDVRQMSDLEVAQLICSLEIDIAVDLKGYSKDCRPHILAHRPAPIQVNYLGYPSTMGANFIDYILVDPFIVPPDQQPYFAERLVHLPDCYQINDRQRSIFEHIPSREDCGLPLNGFVFCSFNDSYKITPKFFDIWMRLLTAVPGSVLWLLSKHPSTAANLRREAQARGVNPDRLIFAEKQDLPEHLARHQLADLFLDNLPYNAHTTASDALWAGLPVLTCAGRSFAARVAGSLLHTIGLPELVTYTLEDYEALALKLATDPDQLNQIKEKLQKNRLRTPLFDCDRLRRQIESAYLEMWTDWQLSKKSLQC